MSFAGEPTPTERLLLTTLRGAATADDLRSFDREALAALARRHRVEHLVRRELRALAPEEPWPGADAAFRVNVARGLAVAALLAELDDLLGAHGVDFLVIKGPAVARHYPRPEDRHVGDLDILVRDADAGWRAYAALAEAGWRPLVFGGDLDEAARRAVYQRYMKDITLASPRSPIRLELHWRLFDSEHEGLAAVMWEDCRRANAGGVHFAVPSPTNELRYLILHGSYSAFFRFKWLVDVVQAIDRDPASAAPVLEAMARDRRFELHHAVFRIVAERLLGHRPPGVGAATDSPRARRVARQALGLIDAPPLRELHGVSILAGVRAQLLRQRYVAAFDPTFAARARRLTATGFHPGDWERLGYPTRAHATHLVARPLMRLGRALGRLR